MAFTLTLSVVVWQADDSDDSLFYCGRPIVSSSSSHAASGRLVDSAPLPSVIEWQSACVSLRTVHEAACRLHVVFQQHLHTHYEVHYEISPEHRLSVEQRRPRRTRRVHHKSDAFRVPEPVSRRKSTSPKPASSVISNKSKSASSQLVRSSASENTGDASLPKKQVDGRG